MSFMVPSRCRLKYAASIVIACDVVGSPVAGQQRLELRTQIDSLITAFQRSTGAPGISVAVVRAGRDTIVFRGYGHANLEHDVHATAQTVYRIGSVTKQFTAAMVMKLVEQGLVSLDATIGALLPQMPIAWHNVTVRQLLNHSGGIPEVTEHARWRSLERDEVSADSVIGLVRADPLEFRPNTRVAYSNTGYLLLGRVIEKVSRQSYPELMDRLFRSLGLTSTTYCDEQAIVKHRAQGYARLHDTLVNARYISMSRPFAAGALCSTVGDLAAWNHALATGRVISPTSFARMTMPEGSAATVRYGYGIWAREFEGRVALTHDGRISGFQAVNGYIPSDSLSVSILMNSEFIDQEQLARLHRMIMRVGLGLAPTPPVITLTGAERKQYIGRYEARAPNGEVEIWHVVEQEDRLFVEQGPIRTMLLPYGGHVFGSPTIDTYRLQFNVIGDQAVAAELVLPELRLRARRIP